MRKLGNPCLGMVIFCALCGPQAKGDDMLCDAENRPGLTD